MRLFGATWPCGCEAALRAVRRSSAATARTESFIVTSVLPRSMVAARLPPVKAVQRELEVPHRTASDWIMRARKDGRLEGMNYAVGRQAEG